MAVSLARLLNIPTFNLINGYDREKLNEMIKASSLPPIRNFNSSYLKPGLEDMFDVILSGCRGRSRNFLESHTIRGFFENDGPLRFVSNDFKEKILENENAGRNVAEEKQIGLERVFSEIKDKAKNKGVTDTFGTT